MAQILEEQSPKVSQYPIYQPKKRMSFKMLHFIAGTSRKFSAQRGQRYLKSIFGPTYKYGQRGPHSRPSNFNF
jgi:hypothetical protein